MEMIRTTSLDGRLQEKLHQARGKKGQVHSTFERTVNILLGEELFTVAVSSIDNAPATMVLERDTLEKLSVKAGEWVYLIENELQIGNWRIDWGAASCWNRRVSAYQLDSSSLRKNLPTALRYVQNSGKAKWLQASLLDGSGFERTLQVMLQQRTESLFQRLRQKDIPAFLTEAEGIIGLGNGLTPSGDDVLTGVMAVLAMEGAPLNIEEKTNKKLLEVARRQTNLISYTTLRHAAEGRVRESLLQLLEALFLHSEESVQISLDTVLSIGSSSGSEIAWGMLRSLECCLELEGKNGPHNDETEGVQQ